MDRVLPKWSTVESQGERGPHRLAALPSGVPPGTVLGPLLFSVYINDFRERLNSLYALFVDDLKLSRIINSPSDRDLLQEDLRTLQLWSNERLLPLNDCCWNMEHWLFIHARLENGRSWREHAWPPEWGQIYVGSRIRHGVRNSICSYLHTDDYVFISSMSYVLFAGVISRIYEHYPGLLATPVSEDICSNWRSQD